METGLLIDSLEICLVGMVLVGLFLACMIGVMNLSARIIEKYFTKKADDKALIAAIVAGIHNNK